MFFENRERVKDKAQDDMKLGILSFSWVFFSELVCQIAKVILVEKHLFFSWV
jgi:hypothetical protein